MSQPTPYDQSHEFFTDETANPNFPGSEIDIELNAVETTTDEILTNLALIQRDDGALKNAVVTVDALSDAVKAMIGDADVLATLEADFAAVDANVALTAADVVSTHADVVLTHADVVTAGASASSATSSAGTATTQAGIATAKAVLTAADAVATAADRVQTGIDAVNAAASAAAAAISADNFDDVYLGTKASDPTLDNDGNALGEGQLYWNSGTNALKIYDGAAWQSYNPLAGISNVVEDTTPQLGGDLDPNGHAITGYSTTAEIAAAYQPLDADLTALAALSTTAAGRTALEVADPGADRVFIWDESAGSGGAFVAATLNAGLEIAGTVIRAEEVHGIALSDETTAITTGTNKATFSLPYAFTVTSVYATLNTVSSSGTPTVDINEAGSTILSTKLTIDANEKTSATAATAAVISDASIAANAEIGFDIDVAGTGAKGLKVFLRGYRT